jgi:hypothetical protein
VDNPDWPKTLDEAVEILIKRLDSSQIAILKNASLEDLIDYHFTWGMSIRNGFGLWKGNTALLTDCGFLDFEADDASLFIIETVAKRVKERY